MERERRDSTHAKMPLDSLERLDGGVLCGKLWYGPPQVAESTHFKSCCLSMERGGRVSLMGGLIVNLPIPHNVIMRRGLMTKGNWIYERADVNSLMMMVEAGSLTWGSRGRDRPVEIFDLEKWDEAFSAAERAGKSGNTGAVVIGP